MPNQWKLTNLYKSEKDPQIQKDIEQSTNLVKEFVTKWENNKEYTQEPKVLKIALDEYEKLASNPVYEKPLLYFALRSYLDQTDTDIKAENNKLSDIYTKLENDIQFFDLKISKISKQNQKKFLEYEPLKPYHHYLEHLFLESKYLLSDKEEKVFNLTAKTSYSNWVDMLNELLDKQESTVIDENGKEVKIHYNDINKYLDSRVKKVRDYAAKEFNRINGKYSEIAEFEINSVLERKKINQDYRKIPRADLSRHISDDIETEVVDTLVNTVTKNFDISKQFYTKKAQLLDQKRLGYYERNVPLEGINQSYSFENALALVRETFEELDPQFADILDMFNSNGEYDVFPDKGKSGGAFCLSVNKNLPTYILLNYHESLEDVLTIAHETGHGINHVLSSKKQNSLNDGNPISLAEIASTFFEDFVLEKVLSNTKDEKTKKAILEKKIHDDTSTIFRQIAFYNFEKDLHKDFREKGFLSKDYISDLFCKHMEAYLGDAIEKDENMRNGWIYVSHFRRPFYVYSYASGLLISKALQAIVREDRKNIVYVKKFLESGSSKSPKELFSELGIDITKEAFWQKGINSIQDNLNKL